MIPKWKFKKQVSPIIIGGFALLIILLIGFRSGQNYLYHQTWEYKLEEHGYSKSDVQIILNHFKTETDLHFFLNETVNKNYPKLLQEKYYLPSNFKAYIKYQEKFDDLPLSEVVRNINVHLDQPFYESKLKTDISKNYLMLVNKYYQLEPDYCPDDLVVIPLDYAWGTYGSQKIRKFVYEAFQDMWQAAADEGYHLMVNSAYRDYHKQQVIYNQYKDQKGREEADRLIARPGASEHETGLALDIFSLSNPKTTTFKLSKEASWLEANSFKFGFILRYPKEKTAITGYNHEAWHYRYIGKKAARYCHEKNLTFEEYYAYFVEPNQK